MGWVYEPDAIGYWISGPVSLTEFSAKTYFPPDAPVLRVAGSGRDATLRWDEFLESGELLAGERARLPGNPDGAGPMTYVVGRLRAPDGCPWDREQTPASLLRYLLDEAYEAAAAIRGEDWDLALDELGDVLLQVVLQSQIQEEAGRFEFSRVARTQAEKLTRRHPHVFAETRAATSREVLDSWETLKSREPQKGVGDESVMPALMAYSRALRRGDVALSPVAERLLAHMQGESETADPKGRAESLVDWLAAGVAAARLWHLEAEWVLWEALHGLRKKP